MQRQLMDNTQTIKNSNTSSDRTDCTVESTQLPWIDRLAISLPLNAHKAGLCLASRVGAVLPSVRFDGDVPNFNLVVTVDAVPMPPPTGDFDPWTTELDLEAVRRGHTSTAEFLRVLAAKVVLQNRAAIEEHGQHVLKALAMVAKFGLSIPDWLARAYLQQYGRFEGHQCRSLDEAFAVVPLTERARRVRKEREELCFVVWAYLFAAILADPERPIDNLLFEEVGERLRIGKTKCRNLYDWGVRERDYQDISHLKQLLRLRGKSTG
jgi:hypothetical protein